MRLSVALRLPDNHATASTFGPGHWSPPASRLEVDCVRPARMMIPYPQQTDLSTTGLARLVVPNAPAAHAVELVPRGGCPSRDMVSSGLGSHSAPSDGRR